VAVTPELVQGKRLFMSTTNGTRALQRVRDVSCVVTAALPNRRAVAERLLANRHQRILILGSGWEGSYSLEDSLAAGALADYLINNSNSKVNIVNDELNAALALWHYWKEDILKCLKTATHGKRLTSLGNYEDDFNCCAQLDCLNIVPTQVEKGVIRAS